MARGLPGLARGSRPPFWDAVAPGGGGRESVKHAG